MYVYQYYGQCGHPSISHVMQISSTFKGGICSNFPAVGLSSGLYRIIDLHIEEHGVE